ncbi:hypothetical protein HK101_006178 [Irineochytrium annulatum]|nr:hypothetical protein HK101_006178 [Irineochytrium annulatum]
MLPTRCLCGVLTAIRSGPPAPWALTLHNRLNSTARPTPPTNPLTPRGTVEGEAQEDTKKPATVTSHAKESAGNEEVWSKSKPAAGVRVGGRAEETPKLPSKPRTPSPKPILTKEQSAAKWKERATTQKFELIPPMAGEHRKERTYRVRGQTGEYNVKIDEECVCTCKDFFMPCKHIIFVKHYKLGIKLDSPSLARFTYRPEEVKEIFEKAAASKGGEDKADEKADGAARKKPEVDEKGGEEK